jgi:hypothetical protein
VASESFLGLMMETAAADQSAFTETVVFLSHFKALKAPRQAGEVVCLLDEILLLCLLTVLAGAETVVDIARFGALRSRHAGTPAHDHLGDILAMLDPAAFRCCFVAWVAARTASLRVGVAHAGL